MLPALGLNEVTVGDFVFVLNDVHEGTVIVFEDHGRAVVIVVVIRGSNDDDVVAGRDRTGDDDVGSRRIRRFGDNPGHLLGFAGVVDGGVEEAKGLAPGEKDE